VSAYPDEIYSVPRSWTEKAYPKLTLRRGNNQSYSSVKLARRSNRCAEQSATWMIEALVSEWPWQKQFADEWRD